MSPEYNPWVFSAKKPKAILDMKRNTKAMEPLRKTLEKMLVIIIAINNPNFLPNAGNINPLK